MIVKIVEGGPFQAATPFGFVDVDLRKGDEAELPDDVARVLVDSGYAEEEKPAKAKRASEKRQ